MAGELSVEERVEGPDVGAPGAAGSVAGFRSWLAMVDVEALSDAGSGWIWWRSWSG